MTQCCHLEGAVVNFGFFSTVKAFQKCGPILQESVQTGIILCMGLADEQWHYTLMSSVSG